ncbi:uncharacterized protein LOC119375597 [Rhipicephalus sanguineus]|uniref:Salivary lipocalin n=1 Tax=Rhipicephalus sanguineus TaxID=34632 RepID=A0A9D4Q9I2_RHISA|nr:uncharacterized protein LOC119375597 [Rhipicephalus sanguineus]KAH7971832.1 hypothetical protein HPB52_003222 [Rhipicephalus sanguineus]
MIKFAAFFLLCSIIVNSQVDDFFAGCVEKPEDEQKPGDCIIAPKRWLSSNTYRYFAHQALENDTIQPDYGNLNTLFEVTRGAAQLSEGIIIRLQFTTVESVCNNSVTYTEKDCPPLGTEVNGQCRALFRYYGYLRLEEASCNPIPEE